jgi:hypothetical protein
VAVRALAVLAAAAQVAAANATRSSRKAFRQLDCSELPIQLPNYAVISKAYAARRYDGFHKKMSYYQAHL